MALEDAANEVDTAVTRQSLKGLSFENPFGGVPSFLRRKLTKDLTGVEIAVTGLPFDQAVTNRPGTRLGPRAIREASCLQAGDPPYGWGINPMTDTAVIDYGDLAFDYARPADVPARIEAHVAMILEAGAACLALGGDHSVTLGALRAHAAKHGPLNLIQFDAHTDTWADDDPTRVDHGTFLYTAAREGIVRPDRSIQVGIRTDNPDPIGFTIRDAATVHGAPLADTIAAIRAAVADGPCYLTFDIDALDPAFAPGTGTPVWGGLASHQAEALLQGLKGLPIVGGDVVEVSPPFDPAGITAVAAAHVATALLCLIAAALPAQASAKDRR